MPCNCRVIDGVWPHYPCGHSKRSLSASAYQGCMGGHIRANERRKLRAAGAASQAGARRATARPRATALAALLRQPRLTVSQQPPRNGRGVFGRPKGLRVVHTPRSRRGQPSRRLWSCSLQPCPAASKQLYRIPQPAATSTRHEVGTTTTAGSTAPPRSIRAVNNSVTRIVNHPHCLNKLYKILSHTCGSVKKPNAATPKLYQPNVTTPKLYYPSSNWG